MRRKQPSKRRWKARLKLAKWVPVQAIEGYSLTAPRGCKLVWHREEEFVGIAPIWWVVHRPYHPDDTKRAWE